MFPPRAVAREKHAGRVGAILCGVCQSPDHGVPGVLDVLCVLAKTVTRSEAHKAGQGVGARNGGGALELGLAVPAAPPAAMKVNDRFQVFPRARGEVDV